MASGWYLKFTNALSNKHPARKIYAIWVYMPEETGRIVLGV
jgi:hypothetical protein